MGVNSLHRRLAPASIPVTNVRALLRPGVAAGKGGRGRRRFLVAVDLSGWIARATHGQGGRLLDYRTLTAYGRAELAGTVATDASSGDGRGRGANAGGGDPEGDGALLDARARDVEYVASCCRQIVARVVCLRAQGRADVLAVLDGCSPPSKRGEVGRRRGRRELFLFS